MSANTMPVYENLKPHQQRVVKEQEDLLDKIKKLEIFLWNDLFNSLDSREKTRLIQQLAYMKSYCYILTERIHNF